jgi:hypothetical protein
MEAAVALDLTFETIEQVALELADTAATETGHVDVVALRAPLIKVLFAFKVHQVKLVYQPMALEM